MEGARRTLRGCPCFGYGARLAACWVEGQRRRQSRMLRPVSSVPTDGGTRALPLRNPNAVHAVAGLKELVVGHFKILLEVRLQFKQKSRSLYSDWCVRGCGSPRNPQNVRRRMDQASFVFLLWRFPLMFLSVCCFLYILSVCCFPYVFFRMFFHRFLI